jgi:hypothetical protein
LEKQQVVVTKGLPTYKRTFIKYQWYSGIYTAKISHKLIGNLPGLTDHILDVLKWIDDFSGSVLCIVTTKYLPGACAGKKDF